MRRLKAAESGIGKAECGVRWEVVWYSVGGASRKVVVCLLFVFSRTIHHTLIGVLSWMFGKKGI